ncbi:MAG: flagellar biosynthetic protein FliO [Planctomycetota bacterium]|nr:flagellar biosynthetic protein FliO [Planctomycetota bacterium]
MFLLALDVPARLGSSGIDLTRYLMVVGLLLAAIVGAAFLLRRMMSGSLKGRAAKRSLAIVEVLPLGGKRQLAVVRCYDRTFALGLGEKDVSLVAELDAVIGAESTAAADEAPFDRLLEVAKSRLALRRRGEEPGPLPTKELVG